MKPKPFRLAALLERRAFEKEQAAIALARAVRVHDAAEHALAELDAHARRAGEAIRGASAGGQTAALRDAYAIWERLQAVRPRLRQAAEQAAAERDRRAAAHVVASRACNAVDQLRKRALAGLAAYEAQLEERELDEANLAVSQRSHRTSHA